MGGGVSGLFWTASAASAGARAAAGWSAIRSAALERWDEEWWAPYGWAARWVMTGGSHGRYGREGASVGVARHSLPLGTDPLFPTSRGGHLSRDAVERLLAKYAARAEHTCPSLHGKRLSPHVLRHTSAMQLLDAGVDTSVIALWLGHETIRTTQIYLHADLRLKERALARTAPPNLAPGRSRPPRTACWLSSRACDYADSTAITTPLNTQLAPPKLCRSA